MCSQLIIWIASSPDEVWTPGDFTDLGGRAAIDTIADGSMLWRNNGTLDQSYD